MEDTKTLLAQHESTSECYKAVAQLRKAQKLAATMISVGASAEDCWNLASRRLAEQLVGVSLSSDVTWAMVAELMS